MRQKDWIIYNNRTGNLWCLAIEQQEDNKWYLIEWVNYKALSQKKLREMVDMGYQTMLDAAIKQHMYEYVIAQYKFPPIMLHGGYWMGLVPEGHAGKKSTNVEVNKDEFEKQVAAVLKEWDIDFKG